MGGASRAATAVLLPSGAAASPSQPVALYGMASRFSKATISTAASTSRQFSSPSSSSRRLPQRRPQYSLVQYRQPSSSRSLQASASSAATPVSTSDAQSAPEQAAAAEAAAPARWTPTSRRVGLIARKVGMTTYFLSTGERVPATVFRVSANQISAQIGFSTPATHEDGTPLTPERMRARMAYTALQVAATDSSSRHGVSRAIRGHLEKAGIKRGKKFIKEFKVSKDANVPLGTFLSAAHFVPGQRIDVRAKSRGKGFQGPMKRHGFKGLPATHGVSISHRSHGSTGQNQDPGRVFPGKKMAGRMGGGQATVHNLEVLRIDTVRDLVLVKGAVPGPEGGHVLLSDAKKALIGKAQLAYYKGITLDKSPATGNEPAAAYLPENIIDLPFPAGTRELAQTLPEIIEIGPKAKIA